MGKRASWKGVSDPEKHPELHRVSKKAGRSYGPLVKGLNGVMVTPKVLQAQKSKYIDL